MDDVGVVFCPWYHMDKNLLCVVYSIKGEGENVQKKVVRLGVVFCLSMLLLCGCEKGPTKEEVENSEYYQKIQSTNKEQKKQIESLEEEVNQMSQALLKEQKKEENQTSAQQGNKKAEEYFEKMQNSSLLRIEIGYTDDYCDPVFVSDKAVFSLAQSIGSNADLTARYTPEELRKEMGAGYIYTLYEEDSSIFQAEVYADGYVIFPDLPGQVYYCPDSALLGQAYLVRKGSYPNSKLLHRMADSAVVVQSGKKAWFQDSCIHVANCIDQMPKEKILKDKKKEEKAVSEYSFYSYGNRMILTLYKSQICITSWDESETWYQITEERVKEIQNAFDE